MIFDWNRRFIDLAQFISTWSKDPSTQVGAVITDQHNRVISVGYNGLPVGISDSTERLQNREIKYDMIVHAEMNAIVFAKRDLSGYKLYTYPFMPCSRCAGVIVQTGITECYAPASSNPRWVNSFDMTREIFHEAGVKLYECT